MKGMGILLEILKSKPMSQLLCGAMFFYLLGVAIYFWKRANQANQGATAEERVGRKLELLKSFGWSVAHDLSIPYWGNADHFVRSPGGTYFCIDTKGFKGRIIEVNQGLYRQYGNKRYPLPSSKNALNAVKGQAAQLKKKYGLGWVSPVLCFERAEVDSQILNKVVDGVLITDLDSLESALRSQSFVFHK
jgi:Nuclease-related domain